MSVTNNELPYLFKKCVNDLQYLNSKEKTNARISFALNNTYLKQIERIETILLDEEKYVMKNDGTKV